MTQFTGLSTIDKLKAMPSPRLYRMEICGVIWWQCEHDLHSETERGATPEEAIDNACEAWMKALK